MNGFQQRLILYSSPLFHQLQCLFKIANYWLVRSSKRQNLVSLRSRDEDNP